MFIDTPKLRIAIFDQDPMMAQGICSLLEKQDNLAALPSSFDQAPDGQDAEVFNIAVIDPSQTKLAPAQIADLLRLRFGNPRLIGFFTTPNVVAARACLTAGFRGLLPKSAGVDGLQTSIAAVHGGALCIDPMLVDVLQVPASSRNAGRKTDLTDRETYVLKSVAQGKSMKEIGQELSLSAKTIETYKARGCTKLSLRGRREIVEHAIRNGWVQ